MILSAALVLPNAIIHSPVLAQSGTAKVDIKNVVNDIAKNLHADPSQLPLTVQAPVDVASKVCGVPVNVLTQHSIGAADCLAGTTSPELDKIVQQVMKANK